MLVPRYYTPGPAVARATPRGETSHGRTPSRAEVPLCGRARTRRLLVVPLRGLEKPAVLRRDPQDYRIHAGEIHDHQSREALAVRLQAHAQSALLRRHAQDPVAPQRSSFRLFLRRRPAPLLAAIGAERAFHGRAGHTPGKFAAHAFAVHVGEADPEAGEARLAQASEHRAEIRHAFDLLELLVEIEAELV